MRENSRKPPTSEATAWDKDLKNKSLPEKQRYEKVKEKAKRIEEAAQRKEKVMNVKTDNAEDTMEVNDMYIDAIKAKLAILESI